MITLPEIRKGKNQIVCLGNHHDIIQSILDFDYLSGKKEGSVTQIITARKGYAKYFFGRQEILIPTASSGTVLKGLECSAPEKQPKKDSPHSFQSNPWFLNLTSGRRTLSSTLGLLEGLTLQDSSQKTRKAAQKGQTLSGIFSGGVLFAENVPELHSLEIINQTSSTDTPTRRPTDQPTRRHADPLIIGPASVGLLVPGSLKLGPIGGITPTQIKESELTTPGSIAVLSASGGMTNELINIAIGSGHHLSFALAFGGDRFPALSPRDAFLMAESDPETKTVLYYGELGGEDEYELLKLREEGKFTKDVIAHIAGTVSSLFKEAPQFGHAKAKANKKSETALAKRKALKEAGFQVSNSFSHFLDLTAKLQH